MQKIDFNKDWMCRCLTRDEEAYPVTLPHDAMLSEPRTQESTGEGNWMVYWWRLRIYQEFLCARGV